MPATVATTARWKPPQSSQPTPSGPATTTSNEATSSTAVATQSQRRRRAGTRCPTVRAARNGTASPSVSRVGSTVRVKPRITTTASSAGQNRCSHPSRPDQPVRASASTWASASASSPGGVAARTSATPPRPTAAATR
jgi:hypothetical protein